MFRREIANCLCLNTYWGVGWPALGPWRWAET